MSWAAMLGPVSGGLLGSYTSKKQDSYNRRAATTEYERSQEATQEAWDRETAYNSPVAQMQRLKEAGLNPNLVYGTGISMTGNTHASPASVPTQISRQVPDYSKSIEKYLTLESLRLNNDIAERTAKNLDVDFQTKIYELDLAKQNSSKTKGSIIDHIGGRVSNLVNKVVDETRQTIPSIKNAQFYKNELRKTQQQSNVIKGIPTFEERRKKMLANY